MEPLKAAELRVLGCLIEKRYSTPDAYPLSLNSLVAACNQSSNRNPVVQYDASIVDDALRSSRQLGLSFVFTGADSRVPKYKENFTEKLGLSRPESAIIAELMLRGPQTPGELRSRILRMCEFADLEAVDLALNALSGREEPLVTALPRQPGKREVRWAHLLGGEVEETEEQAPDSAALVERVAQLEKQMAEVLAILEDLRG